MSWFEPMTDEAGAAAAHASRPIGELLRSQCGLGEQQIEQILAYQRRHGVRFGEAALALRLAQRKDVLEAQ